MEVFLFIDALNTFSYGYMALENPINEVVAFGAITDISNVSTYIHIMDKKNTIAPQLWNTLQTMAGLSCSFLG